MCQLNDSAGRAVAHRLQYLGQSPKPRDPKGFANQRRRTMNARYFASGIALFVVSITWVFGAFHYVASITA